MKGNPITAAKYLLQGFRLLNEPGIRPYVIIPATLNIMVFGLLFGFSINKFSGWYNTIVSFVPDWLAFLGWFIWPLFILLLLIVSFYTFSIIANLIASPFNGFLAEKVEQKLRFDANPNQGLTSPESTNNGFAELMMIVPRSLSREVSKIIYIVPWVIALFVLTLIPAINVIAPILWFVFGAWMMSIQYVDYPMDNHGISMPQLRQSLRERRLSSLGFGGATLVATMIPIVNFFVIPAAICGATIYWFEELNGFEELGGIEKLDGLEDLGNN